MAIVEIAANELLAKTRASFGLPPSPAHPIDEPLLASLLRRAAGILCPCSASTLTSSIVDSLEGLTQDSVALRADVETVLEKLVVYGDLLELHQVTTDDPSVKGTWLFAAPPAFILRAAGASAFIIGIAADDAAPLPEALRMRIRCEGVLRVLTREPSESLSEQLREYGLVELSEQSWLKLPKPETATALRERMERQLLEQTASGEVSELLVLDSSRNSRFYRGRWITPKHESGIFVARRPQAYGADLWGLAQLASGGLVRFLDLPPKNSKWRGCDCAWHLQMAIDHCRGAPQQYRQRRSGDGVIFDFFSPLPIWAERRLSMIGRRSDAWHCLFSYWVSDRDVDAENLFLRERLWLARQDKEEGDC